MHSSISGQRRPTDTNTNTCAPWCADHYDGGEHPVDAYCSSEPVDVAGFRLFLANGRIDDGEQLQRLYVEKVACDGVNRDPGLSVPDAIRLSRALEQLAREMYGA